VAALATLPDGRLVTASWDGVRVWDTRGGVLVAAGEATMITLVEGPYYFGAVSMIVVLPDGRLATGSCGCVRLWRLP